jgi:hypothetical protein
MRILKRERVYDEREKERNQMITMESKRSRVPDGLV